MIDPTLTDLTLETTLQSVVVHNINDQMPTPARPRSNVRPEGTAINGVMVHHSGALGRAGVDGAIRSAEYVIEERDFGALPYHYWICRFPLLDCEGRYVVLRMAPDEERCWHTGQRANDEKVGVVLQGNTNSVPLTMFQRVCLGALLPSLAERHDLPIDDKASWLGWHAIGKQFGAKRNKPQCPGKHAERFLKDWIKQP